MLNKEESIRELKQEIEELEKEIEEKTLQGKPVMIPSVVGAPTYSNSFETSKEYARLKKELEGKKNLLESFESGVFDEKEPLPAFDWEAHLRPEYRKGGYFTSQDYYDKCEEFHKILEEHGEDPLKMPRDEYIYLKKAFFQNTYRITWLSEEEQYLPGTTIDVHAERFN